MIGSGPTGGSWIAMVSSTVYAQIEGADRNQRLLGMLRRREALASVRCSVLIVGKLPIARDPKPQPHVHGGPVRR